MKFTFYQDQNEVNFDFEVNPDTKNKVFGTVLNELFAVVSLQKDAGARFFKLSEPIMMRIESDVFVLDTGIAHKKAQQRLKLNSSPKSKRKFATKFVAIANYMLRKPEVVDVDAVVSLLEVEETVAS